MRLISSPESVEKGEASVLAIAETLLATAVFWGAAWAFDSYRYLLVSLLVAPLLLLRSPQSVAEGAARFKAFLDDNTPITQSGSGGRIRLMFLLSTAAAVATAVALSQCLLPGHADDALFWRAFPIGIAAVMVAGAVAVAVAGEGMNETAVLLRVAALAMVAGVGVVAAGGAGGAAIRGVSAGVAALVGSFLVGMLIAAVTLILVPGVAAVPAITFGAGKWLRSLVVRVVATRHHLAPGWRSLPDNGRHILLVVDSRHPPELVPGLTALTGEGYFEWLVAKFYDGPFREKLFFAPAIVIFCVPALVYRWLLKATGWIYLPLAWLR